MAKEIVKEKTVKAKKPAAKAAHTKNAISDFIESEGRKLMVRKERAAIGVLDLQKIAIAAGEKFGI